GSPSATTRSRARGRRCNRLRPDGPQCAGDRDSWRGATCVGATLVVAPLGRPQWVALRYAPKGRPQGAPLRFKGRYHPCRPRPSAAIQVRQWSCGIGMCVEPKNLNASLTALAKHGTPPTFGLSPTPLAPIGWCGEGVVVQSVSHLGVSTAVGRK